MTGAGGKFAQVNQLAAIIAEAMYDADFEEKASDAEAAGLQIVDRWWADLEDGERSWRIQAHRAAAMAVIRAGYTCAAVSS